MTRNMRVIGNRKTNQVANRRVPLRRGRNPLRSPRTNLALVVLTSTLLWTITSTNSVRCFSSAERGLHHTSSDDWYAVPVAKILGIALSTSEVIVTGGASLVGESDSKEENMSKQRIRVQRIEVPEYQGPKKSKCCARMETDRQ